MRQTRGTEESTQLVAVSRVRAVSSVPFGFL